MRTIFLFFFCFLFLHQTQAQSGQSLAYYLPNTSYDPAIPTPEEYLGWPMGKWHITHDQLVGYMRTLAAASDRIQLVEYGSSHEDRPLLCLMISASKNIQKLDEIKANRQKLLEGTGSVDEQLAVAYMGFSIHGDEASGSNAAPMVAYYLAAAMDPYVKSSLENTVILLDPCFNPDGLQRFTTWSNSNCSKTQQSDPNGREQNEAWPTGRGNHYWFDLNRDWLVGQQPESQGRIRLFADWLPNVLTDHHEMGSFSSFFFQPGIPSRVNPLTPDRNQELTKEIAAFHAETLDKNGIFYFTGERYDDFYYGKGSTFPDINGSVGILFEQASAAGKAIKTDNGVLEFPFSIRNQVFTALSTFKAVGNKRKELNEYMRNFYRDALREAAAAPTKGFAFSGPQSTAFLDLLLRHNIEVYADKNENNQSYIVPFEQPKYRLIHSMLEQRTTFPDSIFYDISAWTLPLAFNLKVADIQNSGWNVKNLGEKITQTPRKTGGIIATNPRAKPYAWLLDWQQYEAPAFLNALLAEGIQAKVAEKVFTMDGKKYLNGTVLISNTLDTKNEAAEGELAARIERLAQTWGVQCEEVYSGYASDGPSLGSNLFASLKQPKTALFVGKGVNSVEAGEIWHLLDTRHGMPPTLIDVEGAGRIDFSAYSVLLMADGSYSGLPTESLKSFVLGGGTIIASGDALRWLSANGIGSISLKPVPNNREYPRRPYEKKEYDRQAFALPGAIFEAEMDLSHPLCFGFEKNTMPIFLGDNLFIQATNSPYESPLVFTKKPLMAGYIHASELPLVAGSTAVVAQTLGKGVVIGFAGDANFRGFWYGTNRLYMNAVFFGQVID